MTEIDEYVSKVIREVNDMNDSDSFYKFILSFLKYSNLKQFEEKNKDLDMRIVHKIIERTNYHLEKDKKYICLDFDIALAKEEVEKAEADLERRN